MRVYKSIILIFAVTLSFLGSSSVFAEPEGADDVVATPKTTTCAKSFLGLPVWYRGLTVSDTDCDIASPDSLEDGKFIWTIVINVIEAATILTGYVSFGFIMYGGFKYLTSGGSSKSIEEAKSTITNAIIGLVLSIVASAIVYFIFNRIQGV